MRKFEVKTDTKVGTFIFYTKANNGKDALRSMINHSCDYKQLLSKSESNSMTIKITPCVKKKVGGVG